MFLSFFPPLILLFLQYPVSRIKLSFFALSQNKISIKLSGILEVTIGPTFSFTSLHHTSEFTSYTPSAVRFGPLHMIAPEIMLPVQVGGKKKTLLNHCGSCSLTLQLSTDTSEFCNRSISCISVSCSERHFSPATKICQC